jgi:DNA-binding response OmpR family regulator
VGADEQRLSARVFLLKTWGYDALAASTAKEALAILMDRLPGTVDVIVADLPLEDLDAEIFVQAKRMDPQVHTLVTSNHSAWYDPLGADVMLRKGSDSPAELLERIRCLTARKREPHKKPVASAELPVESKGRVA